MRALVLCAVLLPALCSGCLTLLYGWTYPPADTTSGGAGFVDAGMTGGSSGTTGGSSGAPVYEPRADMPDALVSFQAATLEGKVYVFGGCNINGCNSGQQAPPDSIHKAYVYDVETDTWSNLPRLPHGRWGGTAVEASGRIYLIGGHEDSNMQLLQAIDEFDPQHATFTQCGGTCPISTIFQNTYGEFPAAASQDGTRIFMFNLGSGHTTLELDVTSAPPQFTNCGGTCPDSGAFRHTTTAVTVGSKIFLVGGVGSTGFVTQPTVEEFDTGSRTWTNCGSTCPDMPEPVQWSPATAVNGKLVLFSGAKFESPEAVSPALHLHEFSPQTHEWRLGEPIPNQGGQKGEAVNAGGRIFTMGGCCASPEVYEYFPDRDR